mmetsp:Transcript_8916/g.27446  ORF Transcript_8916/g.27446 Transcript_8916/m.27446 type:complete len:405 (-) Transcript_8916:70-1284(-)
MVKRGLSTLQLLDRGRGGGEAGHNNGDWRDNSRASEEAAAVLRGRRRGRLQHGVDSRRRGSRPTTADSLHDQRRRPPDDGEKDESCLPGPHLGEFAVEAVEAGEFEEDEVGFGGDVVAPVPGRGEAAVDAGAGVVEVVGAGAVEGVAEEVGEDELFEVARGAEAAADEVADVAVFGREDFDAVQHGDEGPEDAGDLGVLVEEGQGVGDVVVAHVHHGRSDPRRPLALRAQNAHHGRVRARARLDALQALARVAQRVRCVARQEVRLRQAPQPEHVVHDGPPQRQRLLREPELPRVRVRQPRARPVRVADRQRRRVLLHRRRLLRRRQRRAFLLSPLLLLRRCREVVVPRRRRRRRRRRREDVVVVVGAVAAGPRRERRRLAHAGRAAPGRHAAHALVFVVVVLF